VGEQRSRVFTARRSAVGRGLPRLSEPSSFFATRCTLARHGAFGGYPAGNVAAWTPSRTNAHTRPPGGDASGTSRLRPPRVGHPHAQ